MLCMLLLLPAAAVTHGIPGNNKKTPHATSPHATSPHATISTSGMFPNTEYILRAPAGCFRRKYMYDYWIRDFQFLSHITSYSKRDYLR